jgi:hypothetical protein
MALVMAVPRTGRRMESHRTVGDRMGTPRVALVIPTVLAVIIHRTVVQRNRAATMESIATMVRRIPEIKGVNLCQGETIHLLLTRRWKSYRIQGGK